LRVTVKATEGRWPHAKATATAVARRDVRPERAKVIDAYRYARIELLADGVHGAGGGKNPSVCDCDADIRSVLVRI
jgi:hypothetical protein